MLKVRVKLSSMYHRCMKYCYIRIAKLLPAVLPQVIFNQFGEAIINVIKKLDKLNTKWNTNQDS